MKVFFASQFLIASLLMIWNATKKGVWDSLPFRKSSSKSVSMVSPVVCKDLSVPREVDSIYLAKNELPHFEEDLSLIIPSSPLPDERESQPEIETVAFNNEVMPIVSTFTTNVLNHEGQIESLPFISRQTLTKNDLIPSPPVLQPEEKHPLIAASLSLIPGLGHAYLGDTQTAGNLIGSAAVGHSLFLSMYYSDSFYNESVYLSSMTFAQATEFYGIFAAYRDARQRIGNSSYAYKMPTDSLVTLARAPFDMEVLKKPQVWGGIIGALVIARGLVSIAYPAEARIQPKASTSPTTPLLSFPTGLGEEAFFRGFLQSELSEHLTPWGGIAVSSLAFGAAHIPNAFSIDRSLRWRYYAFNIPLITGLGAYFGYLTHKSGSLKESVAVHTWYNFVLMASDALITYTASTGRPGFATSIPF